MNRTVKRCLLGLVVPATLFGMAWAQDNEPAGTVKLGQRAPGPVDGPGIQQVQAPFETELPQPAGIMQFPPSSPGLNGSGGNSGQSAYGNYFKVSAVDQIMVPRFNIDSRGGSLYGYNAGYSNIGVFAPYKLDDSAILFATGQGLITYDGRGGATVGTGWRYWMEDLDRIVGLSAFFDFDNGHAKPYQQLGLSFESLGRYVDYRVNGYVPVSNPDHVLQTSLVGTAALFGNGIGLLRTNTVEQAFSGFDAELGGPTPLLGRYGLNAYIGGYHFIGSGTHGGQFTGVSGRLLSQINEDVSFGVQVTNDNYFGLNTQFQVFVNMPNGKPSRWMRNLRVQDRLVQNVFRQNRVMSKTETFSSYDTAINPVTHQAYFVANIDPNRLVNGDGSVNNPFDSIAHYEALTVAQQKRYDIILVRPNKDGTSNNLDTDSTLNIYSGQRLLSTTVAQTFTTDNLPGVVLPIPGFTGGLDPILVNSSGGNVVTMVGGNTVGEQVSGFNIQGSATGNGIFGNNVLGANISNNTISGGLNGVLLTNASGKMSTNASGTITVGTALQLENNLIQNNIVNGVQITNHGSPPAVRDLDVVVTNNKFLTNGADGLRIDAEAGATIGGLIGGTNVAATTTTAAINRTNTFSGNLGNGLDLTANGGTLNFGDASKGYGIVNNVFSSNTVDGLHINSTNNSIVTLGIINNQFGVAGTSTSGNLRYGLGLAADSGVNTIVIGGDIVTNTDGTTFNPGNTFNFNTTAINLAASGTAALSYDIRNNTIANGSTASIAPVHDAFTFTFNGTSGIDPFIITNKSDAGVNIDSITWNLAPTAATIAQNFDIRTPVLRPLSDTLLTSLNQISVVAGSDPLIVTATRNVATTGEVGLAAGTQLIPMGFTGFAPNAVFQATSRFEQLGGSSALSSAATVGSSVTVNFSNGLSSTQKVALDSLNGIAVSANGDVFGTVTPGYGTGLDGIHVSATGNSVLTHSVIQNNTVTGYGHYGINIETSGSANAGAIIIDNNTLSNNGTGVNSLGINTFDGGGLQVSKGGASVLDAYISNNTITSNFNYGVSILSSGSATENVINLVGNNVTGNVSNGLNVATSGAATLLLNSSGNDFHGNGGGAGKNTGVPTALDNVTFSTSDTSVATINLNNFVGNNAEGNGVSATTNDDSTLNLVIDSPVGGPVSAFSNNKLNGILLVSNERSLMHANVYSSRIENNGSNGIAYNRNGTSLVLSNISDTTMNSNKGSGLFYEGIGSDPTDCAAATQWNVEPHQPDSRHTEQQR